MGSRLSGTSLYIVYGKVAMRDSFLLRLDGAHLTVRDSSILPAPVKMFAYIVLFSVHALYDLSVHPSHV